MTIPLLTYVGALGIGLSLGLLGSGGSILTVPVLVYLVGQDEKVAIAGSLAIVGVVALVSSLHYTRNGLVHWSSVWLFGLPGMFGTYLGAWLAALVPGEFQLFLFAIVVLLASWFMLFPPKIKESDEIARASGKVMADGLLVGALTGLVGVGGGFLIVPALMWLRGLKMRQAVATSLVIVALKSFSGFIKYLDVISDQGMYFDWSVLGLVTAAGVVGSGIGNSLSVHIPQALLQRVFGYFLIGVGLVIFGQTLPGFFN